MQSFFGQFHLSSDNIALNCHSSKGRLKIELPPKSWTHIKAYSGTLCKLGSVCDRIQLFQFQTATLPVVIVHILVYLFH